MSARRTMHADNKTKPKTKCRWARVESSLLFAPVAPRVRRTLQANARNAKPERKDKKTNKESGSLDVDCIRLKAWWCTVRREGHGRKERKKEGRKEGRKERRNERRKEGRKEGRKEKRKQGTNERTLALSGVSSGAFDILLKPRIIQRKEPTTLAQRSRKVTRR